MERPIVEKEDQVREEYPRIAGMSSFWGRGLPMHMYDGAGGKRGGRKWARRCWPYQFSRHRSKRTAILHAEKLLKV